MFRDQQFTMDMTVRSMQAFRVYMNALLSHCVQGPADHYGHDSETMALCMQASCVCMNALLSHCVQGPVDHYGHDSEAMALCMQAFRVNIKESTLMS